MYKHSHVQAHGVSGTKGELERFRAKWNPLRVTTTRQINKPESFPFSEIGHINWSVR